MSAYLASRAADASLADVLAAVQIATLPARRRQEMASALRTIARVLDRPIERIPAHPRLLANRLSEVAPRACGISPARWNNVRALARAALALVQPISPGRQRNLLSPAWKRLADRLESRHVAVSLSRLLRFCSARGIDPDTVCNDTFEEFRLFLSDSLLSDPDKVFIQTARAWRVSQAKIENWPRISVEVPDRRNRWTFKWDRFPASLRRDFNIWRDRLAGRDILDEMPFRAARETTLATREWQVRAFASALVRRGRDPATIRLLADLVEIEPFKEGMRYFLERNGNKRTAGIGGIAAALMAIARHHVRVEPPQLDRLVATVRRLSPDRRGGLTEVNRARLRQFDDHDNVRALLMLPATLTRMAVHDSDRRRGAIQAQLAVAIEILLMAPLRLANLVQLDFDRNLVRPGRGNAVHLVIEAESVKNREPLEYPLPAQSVRLLERYLHEFRPHLAPASSTALFPGRDGGPKKKEWLGKQIFRTIRNHTGLRVNPHLFRHISGKLFLECNPGAYEVVRRVLGHRSADTTISYYTGLETAAAVRHFDDAILKLRGDDRSPASKP
jgi:integrase